MASKCCAFAFAVALALPSVAGAADIQNRSAAIATYVEAGRLFSESIDGLKRCGQDAYASELTEMAYLIVDDMQKAGFDEMEAVRVEMVLITSKMEHGICTASFERKALDKIKVGLSSLKRANKLAGFDCDYVMNIRAPTLMIGSCE